MIIMHNNYIFPPKEERKKSLQTTKDTDGVVRISMEKKVFLYIRSTFGEPVNKDKSDMLFKIAYYMK